MTTVMSNLELQSEPRQRRKRTANNPTDSSVLIPPQKMKVNDRVTKISKAIKDSINMELVVLSLAEVKSLHQKTMDDEGDVPDDAVATAINLATGMLKLNYIFIFIIIQIYVFIC